MHGLATPLALVAGLLLGALVPEAEAAVHSGDLPALVHTVAQAGSPWASAPSTLAQHEEDGADPDEAAPCDPHDLAPHEEGCVETVHTVVSAPGAGTIATEVEHAASHPHPPNIVVVRAISATAWHDGEPSQRWGVGAFYERVVLPNHLEVELALGALFDAETVAIPVDVVLKKFFAISRVWDLSLGVGAVVQPIVGRQDVDLAHDHEPELEVGGIVTGDVYWWFSDVVGLMLEVDGVFLDNAGTFVPELEVGSGISVRF